MEDQAMIDKILSRDRRALLLLYHRFEPRLTRLIHGKIANMHDAEEVLQDTFFAFLEAIRDFHGESKIDTYIYSICHHKIIDYYRRKKIRHFVFSQMPQLEELVSPLLTPEETLDVALLKDKLKKTFRHLVPKYQIVLRLKYIEDLSVSDIAAKLTWTAKATESVLFRARKSFVRVFLSMP